MFVGSSCDEFLKNSTASAYLRVLIAAMPLFRLVSRLQFVAAGPNEYERQPSPEQTMFSS